MMPQQPCPYWLRIDDVKGSYVIPFIQPGRSLCFRIDFGALPPDAIRATITLRKADGKAHRQQLVNRAVPTAAFTKLSPGEYSVAVTAVDDTGADAWETRYRQVGVGAVLSALGDSLTEGYHGHGFKRTILDLDGGDFPPEAVSADSRNFPQFAPTTAHHKPSVNCFQSWLTRLNDGLSAAWQQPVFIANEGWGGYASGQYLAMMRRNHGGWCDRMRLLAPAVWLIHLGVNDERQHVSADTFAANMRTIVDILLSEYGVKPETIYIARPSYDYAPGAEAVLRDYIAKLDALIAEVGLRHGPDFFAAFATDRERWYGADPVHPGPEGVDRMAELWLKALAPNPLLATDSARTHVLTVPQPVPDGAHRAEPDRGRSIRPGNPPQSPQNGRQQ